MLLQETLDYSALKINGHDRNLQLKHPTTDVLDTYGDYMQDKKLYFSIYGKFPTILNLRKVNCPKVCEWMETELSGKIRSRHYEGKYDRSKRKFTPTDTVYLMQNEMILNLSNNFANIYFQQEQEEEAKNLILEIKKRFTKNDGDSSNIYLLVEKKGLELTYIKNKKPTLKMQLCYNDDFQELHQNIVKTLRKKDAVDYIYFMDAPVPENPPIYVH